ncbi:hypothetical protein AS850_13815 [Frondihabitans sp. 762G35]|uniref:sterol carrier family protein n=1 Tax=Frondihabitans sp. 762G35 TaxID=1446794 RepID=UPI000D202918|nr:sterol carrier family protein [Frondihabitans sp. 762G35]ARC58156.1 hypothetical protein AS850_13815 [Frondihabitans sp. 762G35]
MAKVRIDPVVGAAAVRGAVELGAEAPRTTTATAVRYLLQLLGDREPGATVEVRVPPFGAVQFREGLSHTRGTPPNVVETDPQTFVQLATGTLTFAEAHDAARLSASGSRADISDYLPIRWEPRAGA